MTGDDRYLETLAALETRLAQKIDTSDLPEVEDGVVGRRGRLHKPSKMLATIRPDPDSSGTDY